MHSKCCQFKANWFYPLRETITITITMKTIMTYLTTITCLTIMPLILLSTIYRYLSNVKHQNKLIKFICYIKQFLYLMQIRPFFTLKIVLIYLSFLYPLVMGIKQSYARLLYFHPDFEISRVYRSIQYILKYLNPVTYLILFITLYDILIDDRLSLIRENIKFNYRMLEITLPLSDYRNSIFKINLETILTHFMDSDYTNTILITRYRPGPEDQGLGEVLQSYGVPNLYSFGTEDMEYLLITPVHLTDVEPLVSTFLTYPQLYSITAADVFAAINPFNENSYFIEINLAHILAINFIPDISALQTLLPILGVNSRLYQILPRIIEGGSALINYQHDLVNLPFHIAQLEIRIQRSLNFRLFTNIKTTFDIYSNLTRALYLTDYSIHVDGIQTNLQRAKRRRRGLNIDNFFNQFNITYTSPYTHVFYANQMETLISVVYGQRGGLNNQRLPNYLMVFGQNKVIMHGWVNLMIESFNHPNNFMDHLVGEYVALRMANNCNTFSALEPLMGDNFNMPRLVVTNEDPSTFE